MNDIKTDSIKSRINRIRQLSGPNNNTDEHYEAVSIAQSVVHDTVGSNHPVMRALDNALNDSDWLKAVGAHGELSSHYTSKIL